MNSILNDPLQKSALSPDGTLADDIQSKVQELGDLELAILVCLVMQEHCMLSTDIGSNKDLQEELRLICASIFGLQPVIIECSPSTTVDQFSEGILVEPIDDDEDVVQKSGTGPTLSVDIVSSRGRSPSRFGSNTLDVRRIADVIIATNLDLACENVQVQAFELIRTKRIFTRTAMHTASRDFMVLSICSKPGARLSHHLNDLFCMSHFHAESDGLPHLTGQLSKETLPYFSGDNIKDLRILAENTYFTPELAAYLHSIVVFLRNNRYIKGGVTATATRQLRAMSKVLAPLHGINYVPPSLVVLAAHKIYPHRLKLHTAETERSLQWGSNPDAIRQFLQGVTVEDALEDVLASVETPL